MKKKLLSLITALMLVLSVGGINVFANEKNIDESVIIGQFDGNITDYMDSDDPMCKVVSNVRINS